MLLLINHLYAVFYGILSSSLCLAFLYLLGLVSLPRNIFKQSNFSVMPFFYGTALLSLICWYGIQWDIPLFAIFKYLSFLVLLLGIWRFSRAKFSWLSWFFANMGGLKSFFLSYVIFYTLTYVFLPQSFSPHDNLLRWIGNNDILNYINITHYLGHLGPSNVDGHSYIGHASYAATPGVFYCLSLLSVFYSGDTISAAIPMLFTCMALIGFMITRYCRDLFGLSNTVSISIATAIICGAFYRYIAGNYFLSTLMATIPLIYALTETAKINFFTNPGEIQEETRSLKYIFLTTLPTQLLIFFFYPVILFCGFIVQWGLMGLKALCSCDDFSWNTIRIMLSKMLKGTGVLLGCLGLIYLTNPANFISFLTNVSFFAHTTGGWGLSLISPFAILGIPAKMQIKSIGGQIVTLSIFAVFIIVCLRETKNLIKSNVLKKSGLAFFVLSIIAFIAYIFYYYHLGPSRYQPWKFASYYVLPFSGVLWAVFSQLLQTKKTPNSWTWNKVSLVLLILALLGNAFITWRYTPPFQTLSTKYRRLSALDQMNVPGFLIRMSDYSSTFMPAYFIPHKLLYLLSDSYYPMQSLKFNQITPKRPLFIETSGHCVGVTPDKVIQITHVGCLYLTMPTLRFNERVKFSDRPIYIVMTGIGNPEPTGEQWSNESFSTLTLYAKTSTLYHHSNGYIRLKIAPFLDAHIKGQQVNFTWGHNRTLSLFIKKEQWIKLPYHKEDWQQASSKSLKKLTISMQFPDAIPASEINANTQDNRRFALNFIQLLGTSNNDKL
jgi:hypothetical protein